MINLVVSSIITDRIYSLLSLAYKNVSSNPVEKKTYIILSLLLYNFTVETSLKLWRPRPLYFARNSGLSDIDSPPTPLNTPMRPENVDPVELSKSYIV